MLNLLAVCQTTVPILYIGVLIAWLRIEIRQRKRSSLLDLSRASLLEVQSSGSWVAALVQSARQSCDESDRVLANCADTIEDIEERS